MLPIKGHCSYLGFTGYNYHSRNFFRSLSKIYPALKIRNFTVCNNTKEYLNNLDKTILSEQTLFNSHARNEHPLPWNSLITDKNPTEKKVHIILNTIDHYYFYDNYNGYKIAYIVWETTLLPDNFFKKILGFDQLWVVSSWHRENIINQGFPQDRVFVIPQAIDDDIFINSNYSPDTVFRFLISGRWEYRKSTEEIIRTFVNTFSPSDPVELILNCDNQFDKSGLSIKQKLIKYGLDRPNIKIKSFLSRTDYIKCLWETNVFLSCSRGEGWNRPLHETISLGIPSIFSNYGGQLEFTNNLPLRVRILNEVDANCNEETKDFVGKWANPDFNHLSKLMIDVYQNYSFYKNIYQNYRPTVVEKYSSQNIAALAQSAMSALKNNDIIFITGGDKNYLPIIEKLVKSVHLFSNYKIVVYGINCVVDFDYPNLEKKTIDYKITQDSDKWYFKQQICITSLTDYPEYSKFVWIDGDSIVNDNVNKIKTYFNDLENYPIPDVHHVNEYSFFTTDKNGNKTNITKYNELLIEKFNICRSSSILAHVCLFIYNQSCKWFFQEILDIYANLKENKEDKIAICNDEGIDNLLRWKYGFDKFLPQSNFETGFSPEHLQDFFEKNGPYDFGDPYGWTFIPKDKTNVIYFHGNKDIDHAEKIISAIQNKNLNVNLFNISNNIKIDFKKINLTGSTLDIANKYGWFSAIYHEIYNLHDYDHIKEIEIKKNDIVVDIGANFGVFSRYAISRGASKVYAFEPDIRFFDLLESNIRKTDESFCCAINNYIGNCKLYLSDHLGGSTLTESGTNTITTQCFTLDYFFENELFDHIDLLKIDTEGAEINIFEGISDANLLKIKKITLEYHNCFWKNDSEKRERFLMRFKDLGFNTYTLFLGNNDDLQMLYLWL